MLNYTLKFSEWLQIRDPELFMEVSDRKIRTSKFGIYSKSELIEENLAVDAAKWVGGKIKGAYDWHKDMLNAVIDGLKSQFGEMRQDAKDILASGWEKLKPPQIKQIQDAVVKKDWKTVSKVLLTVGVVFLTLFHVGAGSSHAKDLSDAPNDSLLQKGYKDITNMKDWNMPSAFYAENPGIGQNKYKITYDDILNNVHLKIKDFADEGEVEGSIAKKGRDELVPGVDFKIFEVIPSKFIPAISQDPSQFKKSYEKLKTLEPADTDDDEYNKSGTALNSAQSLEHLDDSKIVVFINSEGSAKGAAGFDPDKKVSFSGVSTNFNAMVWNKDTKEYDSNKRHELVYGTLKGRPMFKSQQVVIPYPGDLSKLDIEKLHPSLKRTLIHELRHTTQTADMHGYHVLGKHSDMAKDPTTGQPIRSYLANSHEFGVRVAAFKDASGPNTLKDIFDSSINQAMDLSKANQQEKEAWKNDIKSKFERWISSDDVDRAIDLLHMKQFGEKMGYTPVPELKEDEYQANLKKGIVDLLTPKQKFYNETIVEFLDNFYDQDKQLAELQSAMNNPHARPTGITSHLNKNNIKAELTGFNYRDKKFKQMINDYKDKFKTYLRSNWNYIVKKNSERDQNA